MNISNEKSHFFQDYVKYLRHIIKYTKITVGPAQIQTIKILSSYYRKFIMDFGGIVKPLTTFLKGDNGGISKNQSATIKVTLD